MSRKDTWGRRRARASTPTRTPSSSGPAGCWGRTTADAERRDPDGELARLRAEIEAARERGAEYLALARRAHAELLGYRRRVERERAEDRQAGRAAAVEELLPLLDDLDRALEHLPDDLAEHPWAKGIMLLGLHLQGALERLGVERFGAVGEPFDPERHEAVAHEPRDDVAPDHVATVLRPGYRSGGKLLRAAQVVVAKAPEARAEPTRAPPPPEPGRHVDRRV